MSTWHDRRSATQRALRAALAAVVLAPLLGLASMGAAEAAEYRTDAFPATWSSPLSGSAGGSVNVYANFGALSRGCTNADDDTSDTYKYYLESGYQAHLGVDLGAPAGAGVYAVAAGTVLWSGYNLSGWGSTNGGQILVQHKTTDGTPFVVTYGHVNPIVAQGINVSAGQKIATIYDMRYDHLHLGLRPGTSTTQAPVIPDARYSNSQCNLSGNTAGMVDPLTYLQARRAPGANIAVKNLANQRFVATEVNYSGAWQAQLRAARTSAPIGGWERYKIFGDCKSTAGCGIIALVNNRYVSAELNYTGSGYGMLRARAGSSTSPSWERFRIEGDCATNCAIKSTWSGQYVAAELNYTGTGYGMLRAARATAPIGGWERWSIS